MFCCTKFTVIAVGVFVCLRFMVYRWKQSNTGKYTGPLFIAY